MQCISIHSTPCILISLSMARLFSRIFSKRQYYPHFSWLGDQNSSEREVAESCPTLCDPMEDSPPGSSVHRLPQARILEWGAIPSSRGPSRLRVEPGSPAVQADSLPSEHQGSPQNSILFQCVFKYHVLM